jgi:hypothetical protein
MNKIYLVFLFISSSVLYSQNIKPSLHAVKFEDDSLHVNFTHFQANKITFDFLSQKHLILFIIHARLNARLIQGITILWIINRLLGMIKLMRRAITLM